MSEMFNEEELKISSRLYKNLHLVEITQKTTIDLYNCRDLVEFFKDLNLDQSDGIIFNISQVNYIDSSGLATIIKQSRLCIEKNKKFYIMRPNKAVSHLFQMVGFEKYFTLVDDLPA
ncbi:MAG: STAS domain-containing protein [Leptospiraceae bacterium]|nr:STAS domain-containing protein [Leptospiraceae bacterium]